MTTGGVGPNGQWVSFADQPAASGLYGVKTPMILPLTIGALNLRLAEPLKQLDLPSPIASAWNKEHAYFRAVYGGQNGWNGYKYWAAGAPYPSTSAAPGDIHRFESPVIYVSQDGDTWIQAPNANNPVLGTPVVGNYSNCNLHFDKLRSKLYLVVEWTQAGGTIPGGFSNGVILSESADGINWSTPVVIATAPGATVCDGPTLWQTPSGWALMYIDTTTGGFPTKLMTTASSSPYTGWGAPAAVTFTHPLARTWWRHHVVALPSGLLVGLSLDGTASGGSILGTVSNDGGLTWTSAPLSAWNSAAVGNSWYAPCLMIVDDGGDPTLMAYFARIGPIQNAGFWIQKARLSDDFSQFATNRSALLDQTKRQTQVGRGALAYDSFVRADSTTTLTSTDSGLAWTNSNANVGILTNRAYNPTASNSSAWFDPGIANFDFTAIIDTVGTSFFLQFNISSTSPSDTYWRIGMNGGLAKLQRIAAGAVVADMTFSTTFANGDSLRVIRSGKVMMIYHNDRPVDVLEDITYANNTRLGLQCSGASSSFFRTLTVQPAASA